MEHERTFQRVRDARRQTPCVRVVGEYVLTSSTTLPIKHTPINAHSMALRGHNIYIGALSLYWMYFYNLFFCCCCMLGSAWNTYAFFAELFDLQREWRVRSQSLSSMRRQVGGCKADGRGQSGS